MIFRLRKPVDKVGRTGDTGSDTGALERTKRTQREVLCTSRGRRIGKMVELMVGSARRIGLSWSITQLHRARHQGSLFALQQKPGASCILNHQVEQSIFHFNIHIHIHVHLHCCATRTAIGWRCLLIALGLNL